MAQDPDREEEPLEEESAVDPSPELDMITIFSSQTIDAEMEAGIVKSLMDASGIPAVVTGMPIPSLEYQVMVPRARVEEAQRLIAEQQAAGPEAAAEAEAASEQGQ